jgi:hypothetical protein
VERPCFALLGWLDSRHRHQFRQLPEVLGGGCEEELIAGSAFREKTGRGIRRTDGYGASIRASFRRAAAYVDKVFRGANPADLPVETPTTFEFAINLKTAKALGLLAIRIDRSYVAAHEPLHGPSTTSDNVRR